jgi:hypothetical protein
MTTQGRQLSWPCRIHATILDLREVLPSRLSYFRCTARDSNALKWCPGVSDAEFRLEQLGMWTA